MSSEIESTDRQRMRNLAIYLASFASYIVLSLVRFFFRAYGLNDQPVGTLVLIGLGVCLLGMLAFVLKQGLLARRINRDPKLKAAFDSELHRLLEAQAWKAAYIASAATVLFFAIASSFYPVCDTVMIALTTIIVGAGAQRASFYLKYRAL